MMNDVRYMFDNFFKHIDIDPKNAHVLDGNAVDLVAECEEYEKKIAAAGGIELFVGGASISLSLSLYHNHNCLFSLGGCSQTSSRGFC